VRKKLPKIQKKYKLLTLDMVVDGKDDKTETLHFTASASKTESGSKKKVIVAAEMKEVALKTLFKSKEKKATAKKLATTHKEFEDQVTMQESALNNLTVSVWKTNWKKFHGDGKVGGEGRTGQAEASAKRAELIAVERTAMSLRIKADHPTATNTEIDVFLDTQLFRPNPGDKAYPFKNKAATFNKVRYTNPAYGKALLHGADQVVGGGPGTAVLGGARENFSIGAQWEQGGRAQELKAGIDAELANMATSNTPKAINDAKLKVKLLPIQKV
jgi:Novel toxin 15